MIRTLAFVLSASLAACAGGQAEVHYTGEVTTPELVTMESDPSVMIVANADEPVFYSENTYYLYRDQRWFRSSSHRGGWARVETPPEHIRRIERPTAYVHVRRDVPQTTMNTRTQPEPRAPENRAPSTEPDRERVEPVAPPAAPPPAAAPRPEATRAPERPDPSINRSEPTLRGPGSTPGSQRPSPNAPAPVPPPPNPMPGDRPEPQIAPDPDRAPAAPGQPVRTIEPRAPERNDRPVVDPNNDPARPSYK